MGSKTKKIQHAGRFSGGIGVRARNRFNAVESQQRRRQTSPYYSKGKVKRIAMGIWKDVKTGKIFAGPAYSLNK